MGATLQSGRRRLDNADLGSNGHGGSALRAARLAALLASRCGRLSGAGSGAGLTLGFWGFAGSSAVGRRLRPTQPVPVTAIRSKARPETKPGRQGGLIPAQRFANDIRCTLQVATDLGAFIGAQDIEQLCRSFRHQRARPCRDGNVGCAQTSSTSSRSLNARHSTRSPDRCKAMKGFGCVPAKTIIPILPRYGACALSRETYTRTSFSDVNAGDPRPYRGARSCTISLATPNSGRRPRRALSRRHCLGAAGKALEALHWGLRDASRSGRRPIRRSPPGPRRGVRGRPAARRARPGDRGDARGQRAASSSDSCCQRDSG